MSPIVDPSWPRMSSDMENPFQNAPGLFIYALPDLRFSLSFGPSTCCVHSTTVHSTPSLPQTPLEGLVASIPYDESAFDHDECPDSTQGESEPKLKQGQEERDSELDAKSQSVSRTHTPSPPSSTSSSSSEQERTTKKTKRSRRRRRRNAPVVDVGGWVMGPRMGLHIPYWSQSHISGVISPSPWSPVVTAPGGEQWFKLQTGPGC